MARTCQALPSFGQYSSLASDPNTKTLCASATPTHPSKRYADFSFVDLLGLAQHFEISFLPLTWQEALGALGEGGEARINQSLITAQTSFAFKRFHRQDHKPLREIVQELLVLGYPTIHDHEYIVTLEGICWDFLPEGEVWPILVFEKTHFGDLSHFASSERFEKLSIGNRLSLCVDIGIAIRDMQYNGIIHGDIKPDNVLIFEKESQIIAQVADFGFSTWFQDHDDWISMPKSEPWNAPEHGTQSFRSLAAKRMDIYSFGMLCFWLMFEAGSSNNISPPPDIVLKSGEFFSFARCHSNLNLLQRWKNDSNDKLVNWVSWLVIQDKRLDDSTRENLLQFYRSVLVFDPQSRCTELDYLLQLLAPSRALPRKPELEMESNLERILNFRIGASFQELCIADFRLREFVVECLKRAVNESAVSTTQSKFIRKAALQLALSYYIGFGTKKDDSQVMLILEKYSLDYDDLQGQTNYIVNPSDGGSKYTQQSFLQFQGYTLNDDLDYIYRDNGLLERAQLRYEQEIQDLELVFDTTLMVHFGLVSQLVRIYMQQEKLKEAEELLVPNVEIRKKVLGSQHLYTLGNMSVLARIYKAQYQLKKAEELQRHVMETRKRILGSENSNTLLSMAYLAATYRYQGKLTEAEKLEMEILETNKRILGDKHILTLESMYNLALTYSDQKRWKKAEDSFMQVMKASSMVLRKNHRLTMRSPIDLASVYINQGRWKEAEELLAQAPEMDQTAHPDVLVCMNNVAVAYAQQEKLEKAGELFTRIIRLRKRAIGEEHPRTLNSISNMASIYYKQGRWDNAKDVLEQVLETRKRLPDCECPSILPSMDKLLSIYEREDRRQKAEELLLQMIEIKRKIDTTSQHPDTLAFMAKLASMYQNQGRWTEAEYLLSKVIETRKRTLGIQHSSTLANINNMASIHYQQGQWEKAKELLVQVMEVQRKIDPASENPNTLTIMANLASTYGNQQQWKEAANLFSQVAERRRTTLGIEHAHTITTVLDLASVLKNQGKWKEAEELEAQTVEIKKRALRVENAPLLPDMASQASM